MASRASAPGVPAPVRLATSSRVSGPAATSATRHGSGGVPVPDTLAGAGAPTRVATALSIPLHG